LLPPGRIIFFTWINTWININVVWLLLLITHTQQLNTKSCVLKGSRCELLLGLDKCFVIHLQISVPLPDYYWLYKHDIYLYSCHSLKAKIIGNNVLVCKSLSRKVIKNWNHPGQSRPSKQQYFLNLKSSTFVQCMFAWSSSVLFLCCSLIVLLKFYWILDPKDPNNSTDGCTTPWEKWILTNRKLHKHLLYEFRDHSMDINFGSGNDLLKLIHIRNWFVIECNSCY